VLGVTDMEKCPAPLVIQGLGYCAYRGDECRVGGMVCVGTDTRASAAWCRARLGRANHSMIE